MTNEQLRKFLSYLEKNNSIIGPAYINKKTGELIIKKIENLDELALTNEIPLYSFKKFLLPTNEILISGTQNKQKVIKQNNERMVLVGLTILDLRALTILNQIFEKDPYYQNKIKNTLIIGYNKFPCEYKGLMAGHYEEDILEHFQFDLFIVEGAGSKKYKILSGSEDGQRILDEFGYSKYENVQFSGPIKEEGLDAKMMKIHQALKNVSSESKIFSDLGKKCIECGRCSLVCPLCYCFCLKDNMVADFSRKKCELVVNKEKTLTTCFYSEFSEIAGGYKFLKTPAQRIYNWYEHKFIRLPDELSLMGCVGCGRCAKICPAGIDIKDVLMDITLQNGAK